MNQERMRRGRLAAAATAVVLLNLAIAQAHGPSHARSEVPLEPRQLAFVRGVVFAAPLLAAALLGSAMLAGTAFGVSFHFVADTADHVCYRPSDGGGTLFVVTAALLVPAGALGAAFGAWSWWRLERAA